MIEPSQESTLPARRIGPRIAWIAGALAVIALLIWQGVSRGGNPNPTLDHSSTAASIDIAVLVFREGLECILVLSAITASMVGDSKLYRRPITLGAAVAFVATLLTWRIVVGILDSIEDSVPALDLQAATGLIAIIVLLIVMNWFFHKFYWSGWISLHTKKKRALLKSVDRGESRARVAWGLAALGFTSLYREGFEVVLFLQNYRLKLGGHAVLNGVIVGLIFAGIVAVLTFVAHRKLPYKRMLVLTGALLGVVLLVMVGEQAQEMQLAHWIGTTPIPALEGVIRPWMGLWFAIFPTVETLVAQAIAAVLVLGSYAVVEVQLSRQRTAAVQHDVSLGLLQPHNTAD
ncbi:MAG TPA: FTR1 family protein [Gemmatimonadaceae bacterium]|nr:FTR1 family protein [Gemmatimonadaceae bacterium]